MATVQTPAAIRIQSFLNDPSYKDIIEHAASYNTRLVIERKMRLPFLDAQTGVAQSDCVLWMNKRQRMPGLTPAQLYTYPSKRWRKKKRQYQMNFMRPRMINRDSDVFDDHPSNLLDASIISNNDDSIMQSSAMDDSRDSWYRDYMEEAMFDPPDAGELDDGEDDFDDYEEQFVKKKKKKAPVVRKRKDRAFDPATEAEKPFGCELCGARYKTRPGLSYHYSHTHNGQRHKIDPDREMNMEDDDSSSQTATGLGGPVPTAGPQITTLGGPGGPPPNQASHPTYQSLQPANKGASSFAQQHLGQSQQMRGYGAIGNRLPYPSSTAATSVTPVITTVPPPMPHQMPPMMSHSQPPVNRPMPVHQPPITSTPMPGPPKPNLNPQDTSRDLSRENSRDGMSDTSKEDRDEKGDSASPYCDFCLGDAAENKKTRQAEELISCSDCGRSGHPTCLQFTPNMMVSVKQYRWQCIECKCCTVCGTSDNDDQLLFCDDCDRGYHMYCLEPPLAEPPEGSWSCHLCIAAFHKK